MESREKREAEDTVERNIEEEAAPVAEIQNGTTAEEPVTSSTENEDTEVQDLEKVRIMIATSDKIISGDLQLPSMEVTENPTAESLLFYALNCGNQFIALRDCSIMDKDNTEFEPEKVKFYVININIVESCRIVPKDTRKASANKQYNMDETI